MSTPPPPPPPAPVPPPSFSPPPPPQYGPPDPHQSRSVNGFAIAALVCGIAAPCGLGVLSLVFGFIALGQIRRSGDRGRKMAIGGMITTGVWVAVLLLVAAIAIVVGINSESGGGSSAASADHERDAAVDDDRWGRDDGATDRDDADRPDRQQGQHRRLVVVDDLQAGDCLEDALGEGRTRAVWVVSCNEPHMAEVFHQFDLDDGPYPQDTVTDEAEYGCAYFLLDTVPSVRDDHALDLFFFFPTAQTWEFGDREVICLTHYLDGPRTGSLIDNASQSV